MKINRLVGMLVLAAWLCNGVVWGQQAGTPPIYPPPAPLLPNGEPERRGEQLSTPGVLSDWILNKRACCESPPGKYTPMYTEFYINAGPSIPFSGETLSRELKTGWSITGGVRALFFDEPHTSAWVVDLHMINTNQSAGQHNTQYPVTFFQAGVRSDQVVFQGAAGRTTFSVQNSNRTLVGVGTGKEWYLWQPADFDGCKWRVGIDGGGRYGSHRVNFSEFGHLVDVCGSVYAAGHTDFEFPWRSVILHAGVRLEWAYTWTDVLQRTSDIQEISLLLNVGVRY